MKSGLGNKDKRKSHRPMNNAIGSRMMILKMIIKMMMIIEMMMLIKMLLMIKMIDMNGNDKWLLSFFLFVFSNSLEFECFFLSNYNIATMGTLYTVCLIVALSLLISSSDNCSSSLNKLISSGHLNYHQVASRLDDR